MKETNSDSSFLKPLFTISPPFKGIAYVKAFCEYLHLVPSSQLCLTRTINVINIDYKIKTSRLYSRFAGFQSKYYQFFRKPIPFKVFVKYCLIFQYSYKCFYNTINIMTHLYIHISIILFPFQLYYYEHIVHFRIYRVYI